jgi:hypothetical protein
LTTKYIRLSAAEGIRCSEFLRREKMNARKMVYAVAPTVVLVFALVAVSASAALQPAASAEELRTSPDGKGYRFDRDGWIYVHIEGEPHERGYQYGYLVAPELAEILEKMKGLTYLNTGMEWEFFVEQAEEQFVPRVGEEFLEEIKGIADGAQAAGTAVAWQDVLTWNGYEELTDYWWPNEMAQWYENYVPPENDHCSAFIATGSYTRDGKVVMGHNSWDNFEHGQYLNEILDIQPAQGYRIFMQSVPGFIDSYSDFFVTGAGIMGTETTIGGFGQYKADEAPEFYRARRAMQYAKDLDEWVELMKKQNNGGYANSWLLADLNTGEIMRFELGLKFTNVERTKDGYFAGFNAPEDPRIRNLECSNTGYADVRRHQGARRVRLMQLMEKYRGKIDVKNGKKILADHYDVYLEKENPCSRTVDGHYELDAREYMSQPGRPLPFQPRGTVDGKVMTSDLAAGLSFWARWGNSSGTPFDADDFLAEHAQWSHLDGYLKDRPTQPWSLFTASQKQ